MTEKKMEYNTLSLPAEWGNAHAPDYDAEIESMCGCWNHDSQPPAKCLPQQLFSSAAAVPSSPLPRRWHPHHHYFFLFLQHFHYCCWSAIGNPLSRQKTQIAVTHWIPGPSTGADRADQRATEPGKRHAIWNFPIPVRYHHFASVVNPEVKFLCYAISSFARLSYLYIIKNFPLNISVRNFIFLSVCRHDVSHNAKMCEKGIVIILERKTSVSANQFNSH